MPRGVQHDQDTKFTAAFDEVFRSEGIGTRKTQVCSPNETRICYGPGACQGGQYCLPDGSAYSACDCGTKGDAGVPPGSQK